MDVLLSSGFAHGYYIEATNVIATSCLFSVCWIVYLKAINFYFYNKYPV